MRILFMFIVLAGIQTGLLAQSSEEELFPFDEIRVFGNFHLIIEQGEVESYTIDAHRIDDDKILVEVVGSSLNIRTRPLMFRDYDVEVRITYKDLEKIRLDAGATLESRDVIEGGRFEIVVTKGSSAELEMDVSKLYTRVSYGSDLELGGQVDILEAKLYSGSNLNAYDLEAKEVIIKASTGSDARVYASEIIEAFAIMGASIYFRGDPEETYLDSNFGGTVRPKRSF